MLNLLVQKLISKVHLQILQLERLVSKVPFANPANRLFKGSTDKRVPTLTSDNDGYSLSNSFISAWLCAGPSGPSKEEGTSFLWVTDENTENPDGVPDLPKVVLL